MRKPESALARHPALFAGELAAFASIFWADPWLPLSKTPFFFAVAWLSLWLRGVTWRSLGFATPRSWPRALALGAAAGVAMFALEFFVTQELLFALTGEYPDLHEFDALVGNLPLLVLLLALNFVFAALGEELVWRGYALSRVAESLGSSRVAWVAALVLVNVGFGLAHLYQGETGVVETTIAGVLLGALYLASGRNLVIPMAAHFMSNTIDFIVIYVGWYPGVGA
ncbi:MAG TPA: type II CAAX endopeptidase family protein [Myxococcota bacterium]|nr:type II CAAX endopeptidase family protein [Myxococcota bacterium]